jgi:hypothetical protein
VISNCVINLAPDKPAVFREMARVLKPNGRLAVSDIVLKRPLPPESGTDLLAYIGCIAGAISIDDYRSGLAAAGFEAVQIIDTGADLNAYAQVEGQAGCCSPAMGDGLPMVSSCSFDLHGEIRELLARYNVNDYVASAKISAVKPI